MQEQAGNVIAALMAADPDGPKVGEAERLAYAQMLSGAMQSLASWWLDHPELPRETLVE